MQKKISADPLVLLLLLLSLGLKVFLGLRLYRPAYPSGGPSIGGQLAEGSVVPEIKAKTAEGQPYTLKYGEDRRPTVLYVFSSDCIWCDRNADNLTAIMKASQANYRFVGISMAGPSSGSVVPPDTLVLHELDENTRRAYSLGPTPYTIVVSPQGRVIKSWRGAYTRQTAVEIEKFFSLALPGLRTSEGARDD
jgi:peroxiredoxin